MDGLKGYMGVVCCICGDRGIGGRSDGMPRLDRLSVDCLWWLFLETPKSFPEEGIESGEYGGVGKAAE